MCASPSLYLGQKTNICGCDVGQLDTSYEVTSPGTLDVIVNAKFIQVLRARFLKKLICLDDFLFKGVLLYMVAET